jgi:hypothetical protein
LRRCPIRNEKRETPMNFISKPTTLPGSSGNFNTKHTKRNIYNTIEHKPNPNPCVKASQHSTGPNQYKADIENKTYQMLVVD